MSLVNVINVVCGNAKAPFLSNVSFDIYFEALQPLPKSKNHCAIALKPLKLLLSTNYNLD
jgi:ASF1 like histone chaperone